ncbi:MAG: alpha-ketoglutarate-dependent dioxygenase AlkB [Rhodobacteraceae bacterium]|nr:alpha-ketoglutarate-dependent dioxygenase AlkB [Paracoccaceae bacterium]
MTALRVNGFDIHKAYLTPDAQRALVEDLRGVLKAAPLISPRTPSGKPMSVRMTAAGSLGWITDSKGYRYAPNHPRGTSWPEIPDAILQIWRRLVSADRLPDCCLINYYGEDARMGLHQDKDEADFSWPVLSISLGDDALFRMGEARRGGKTASHWLTSGDVVVMGSEARLAYHGVDRIRFGSSRLLPKGGRINLTLRVVT